MVSIGKSGLCSDCPAGLVTNQGSYLWYKSDTFGYFGEHSHSEKDIQCIMLNIINCSSLLFSKKGFSAIRNSVDVRFDHMLQNWRREMFMFQFQREPALTAEQVESQEWENSFAFSKKNLLLTADNCLNGTGGSWRRWWRGYLNVCGEAI